MLGSFPPELRGRLAATSLLRSREPTLSCNHPSRLYRDERAVGSPGIDFETWDSERLGATSLRRFCRKSGKAESSGFFGRALQPDILRPHPSQTQQRNQRDHPLRDHAIQAPHPQSELLDKRQPQRKAQPHQRAQKHQRPLPPKRQPTQHQVAGNPDRRHRNPRDLRKRAMVHDPAIPFLVDRARLRIFAIMYVQRQRGNHHANHRQHSNQVSHHRDFDATRATSHATMDA